MTDDRINIEEMRPFFRAADSLDAPIERLIAPVRTWKAWARRLYVLTWPLAIILRPLLILILMIMSAILHGLGMCALGLYAKWTGRRTIWD